MGIFSWVIGVFRGYTSSFNPFECRLLEAVIERLPNDAAQRTTKRISQVNRVYRLDGGREVNCYVMQNGKACLPNETRTIDEAGEVVLAQFSIESSEDMTRNQGKVLLIDGNLFSLLFQNPTEHADAEAIVNVSIAIEGGLFD